MPARASRASECKDCQAPHPPGTSCRIPHSPYYVIWSRAGGIAEVALADTPEAAESLAKAVLGRYGDRLVMGSGERVRVARKKPALVTNSGPRILVLRSAAQYS